MNSHRRRVRFRLLLLNILAVFLLLYLCFFFWTARQKSAIGSYKSDTSPFRNTRLTIGDKGKEKEKEKEKKEIGREFAKEKENRKEEEKVKEEETPTPQTKIPATIEVPKELDERTRELLEQLRKNEAVETKTNSAPAEFRSQPAAAAGKFTTWRCLDFRSPDGKVVEDFMPLNIQGLVGVVCTFRNICYWKRRWRIFLHKEDKILNGNTYFRFPAHSTRTRDNAQDANSDAAFTVTYVDNLGKEVFQNQTKKVTWWKSFTWGIEMTYFHNIWHWWEWLTPVFAARMRRPENFPVASHVLFSTHPLPSAHVYHFMLSVLSLVLDHPLPRLHFPDYPDLLESADVDFEKFQLKKFDPMVRSTPEAVDWTEDAPLCLDWMAIPSNGVLFFANDLELWRSKLWKRYQISPIPDPQKIPFRLVYIERTKSRKVMNKEVIFEFLKNHSIPYWEADHRGMSFSDRVQIIAKSGVMLTMHGAGDTNALFLQEGAAFVEMLPYLYELEFWKPMADNLKLKYFSWMNSHYHNTVWMTTYNRSLDSFPTFGEVCSGTFNSHCLQARQASHTYINITELGPIILKAFKSIGYDIPLKI